VFSITLTTCYFYLQYEKDHKERMIIKEVIRMVKKNSETIVGKKQKLSSKINFIIRLLPIFLAVIASIPLVFLATSFANLLTHFGDLTKVVMTFKIFNILSILIFGRDSLYS
jgi:hypothetical protein